MEGLFEIAFESILRGAIEIVEYYYGPVSYSVAEKLVRGESSPADEKERTLVVVFETLKHMFILRCTIEPIKEDSYVRAEEVIEALQEDILKYILLLIEDIGKNEELVTREMTPEIAEEIVRAIDAYRKIGDVGKIQQRIMEKLKTIRSPKTTTMILEALK